MLEPRSNPGVHEEPQGETRASGDGLSELIVKDRSGFAEGFTSITCEDDPVLGEAVDFGIQVMRRGQRFDEAHTKESVWVLLHGRAQVAYEDKQFVVERKSLFDEAPTAVHLGPGTRLRIQAQSDRVEWAVVCVGNDASFATRTFWPADIEPEYRGLGLAQGTCLRNVRLIFDRERRPQSNIVLGEVITYPGRWSSYPPHHHAQPEIYHYRFSEPQGYGHGEVGERVYRVRQFDTLRIRSDHDHAQVAAPGYAMYYLWIVRHLRNNAYSGFEFTTEHTWMLDPKASIWEPNDVPYTRRQASASNAANAAEGTKQRPWTRSSGDGGSDGVARGAGDVGSDGKVGSDGDARSNGEAGPDATGTAGRPG